MCHSMVNGAQTLVAASGAMHAIDSVRRVTAKASCRAMLQVLTYENAPQLPQDRVRAS